MKNICFVPILTILLSGALCCKQNDEPTDTTVEIRVKNASDFDFSDLMIGAPGGNKDYGFLKSGQYSAYQTYDFAYRYAYVELKIDGQRYGLQPIDFVGEQKLKKGKYTYELNAVKTPAGGGSVTLILIED